MKKREIIELSRDEYMFLTNKFEIMTEVQAKQLPSFIVSTKKNNFERVIRLAMENELDELERKYINEKYFLLMSVADIANKHGTNRQAVYRVLNRASDKLFVVLKYVFCCGFSLLNPPENLEEMISQITRSDNLCEK